MNAAATLALCPDVTDRQKLTSSVVLVVDDSRAVHLMVRRILEDLGIRSLLSAEDGEEGLALATSHVPDLVISDYEMEPMNGICLVSALRGSPAKSINKIPVIMLTGQTGREVRQKAIDAGVNDVLLKPIKPKALTALVLRLLGASGPG